MIYIGIETLPVWRCHGHAKAILQRFVEISGMPVRAMEINEGAESFWDHMTDLGINEPTFKKEDA